jgi:hypothetical protein
MLETIILQSTDAGERFADSRSRTMEEIKNDDAMSGYEHHQKSMDDRCTAD